ncbi:MAG: hypothetical protein WCT52_00730 [Candidatus Micrarchaeia archaeon]
MAHKGKEAGKVSQRSIYLFLLAAVIYVVAAYVGFFTPNPDQFTVSMLVSMATAMVAIGAVRAWQESRGEALVDERVKLVNRIAVSYSWSATYLLIAVLILVQQFKLAVLNVESLLSLIFFFMIAVLIVARFYLSRKGELE